MTKNLKNETNRAAAQNYKDYTILEEEGVVKLRLNLVRPEVLTCNGNRQDILFHEFTVAQFQTELYCREMRETLTPLLMDAFHELNRYLFDQEKAPQGGDLPFEPMDPLPLSPFWDRDPK